MSVEKSTSDLFHHHIERFPFLSRKLKALRFIYCIDKLVVGNSSVTWIARRGQKKFQLA
jgi:hypothetical protein